jgi:hypothetical protein
MRLVAMVAVRSDTIENATWDQFLGLDGPEPLWQIPSSNMKGDALTIPVPAQDVDVLLIRPG